jgi:hypothetical protein
MSRFLMAWPNSTIGTRIYRAGDLDAAPLRAFDDRVRALLDAEMPLDEDGTPHQKSGFRPLRSKLGGHCTITSSARCTEEANLLT